MVPFEPGSQMTLSVAEHVPGRTDVTLSGSLDLATAKRLDERLREAVARDETRVLALDLSAVDFCDCAALGVLIGVRAEGQLVGCATVISAASPAMLWLLEVFGLDLSLGYALSEPGRGESSG